MSRLPGSLGHLVPPSDDWIGAALREIRGEIAQLQGIGWKGVSDLTQNDAGGTLHYSDGSTSPIQLGSSSIYGATLSVAPYVITKTLGDAPINLTATFHSSTGGTSTVTSSCTWASTNNAVATVDSGGQVTFHQDGSVYILCTYVLPSVTYTVEALITVLGGTVTQGTGGIQAGAITSSPNLQNAFPLDVANSLPSGLPNTSFAPGGPTEAGVEAGSLFTGANQGPGHAVLVDTTGAALDPADPRALKAAWFVWKCPATGTYQFAFESTNLTLPLPLPALYCYKLLHSPATWADWGGTNWTGSTGSNPSLQYVGFAQQGTGNNIAGYGNFAVTAHAGDIYYFRLCSLLTSTPGNTGYCRLFYVKGAPLS